MQEEELRGKVALVTGSEPRHRARCCARIGARGLRCRPDPGRGEFKLKAVAAEIEALGREPAIHAAEPHHAGRARRTGGCC